MSNHGTDDILSRTQFEQLKRELAEQRMHPDAKIGATGEHPEGKLTPEDEGEIRLAVAADRQARKVVIDFGKPVAWMGMNPQQARELGTMLCRKAGEVDGVVVRVSFGGDL